MVKYKWNVKSSITDNAKSLSKEIGIAPVVAQVFINRGLTSSGDIKDFMSPALSALPDPFLLSDAKSAAERIADAIDKKEKICVYGDYDIDGSTAVAVLAGFFRELGTPFIYYQPERFGEGYGMSADSMKRVIDQGVKLIISVDCGTSNIEAAEYCKKEGVDLIITDHHKLGELTPDVYAFVNPHKPGEPEQFLNLAGVGVAYYLAIALRKVLRERDYFNGKRKEPDLKTYLDLVAFGTVADVVPILGVNRILVKRGLEFINSNPRKGIRALADISGLKGGITSDSISYILAPRLNAAGRMGSASRSVELLLSDDETESQNLAVVLHEENQKRVSFQNKSWQQVQEIAETSAGLDSRYSLTFASEGWHQGVIGIIASKAVEKWYKPTAVYAINNDVAKGSARSIHGIDIFSVFSEFREIFEDFGGHDMAAGMSIKTDRIPKFEELFEAGVSKYVKSKKIHPVINVDVEVKTSDINLKAVNEIISMEPFGSDNPYPIFLCRNIKVFSKTVLKDKHLKLKLENGIDAIGFNMGGMEQHTDDHIDIVFKPSINDWNGTRQVQYVIVDIE